MPTKVRVFLDTSALFAGIWSATGGARMILRLGEAGAIRLFASPHVLGEIEKALRRKVPDALGSLALLLDRSGVEIAPSAEADYFVTLDKEHFLGDSGLREAVPFPVGTPGDFLAFFRGRLA